MRLASRVPAKSSRFEPTLVELPTKNSSKFVQKLLGHASIVITLDTYSHMLPGIGGEAADAVGEALG